MSRRDLYVVTMAIGNNEAVVNVTQLILSPQRQLIHIHN